MKFLRKLSDIYFSRISDNVQSDDANKPFVIHLFSLIMFFACLVFGFILLFKHQIIQAVILFTASLGGLISYYINKKLENFRLSRFIITLLSVIVLLHAFITGGLSGTGYLWSFTFPASAILLYGNRKGGLLSFVFVVLLFAFVLLQDILNLGVSYSTGFALKFAGVYLLIYVFLYLLEAERDINIKRQEKSIIESRTETKKKDDFI